MLEGVSILIKNKCEYVYMNIIIEQLITLHGQGYFQIFWGIDDS